jgi:hypothetical protein
MRRVFRKLTTRKSDEDAAEAKAKAANSTTDASLDDTAWGLDVWIEGVDPVVE